MSMSAQACMEHIPQPGHELGGSVPLPASRTQGLLCDAVYGELAWNAFHYWATSWVAVSPSGFRPTWRSVRGGAP